MSQHDRFAADIWNGDTSTIAALQDMTSQDLRGIETLAKRQNTHRDSSGQPPHSIYESSHLFVTWFR